MSVESAQCGVCHDELLEGRPSVHAPAAEDCTTCHEFEVGDTGTTVALMDSEPALCVLCHDELTAAVEMDLEAPHFPVADSCLNCHDPHAGAARPLLSLPATGLCAECHDMAELEEPHGGQLTPATRCAACHSVHGSNNDRMLLASQKHAPFEEGSCKGCHRAPFGDRIRLRARGERLCTACHGDVAGEAGEQGSVHAALEGEQGRAGCLSCHDPHMSDHPFMLEAGGPELCSRCHTAVVEAATAETGHFAAADDCGNCHRPHASTLGKLLSEPPAELCSTCHDTDEELSAAHLGADVGRLDCISCHTPHGAGHPKLLAEHLHPPVEDGCDTCHEGGHDELMEGGGSELCTFCHDDVAEAAAEATVPHAALEIGSCTDCHNPHASKQEKLVKGPGAGPCAECHDEQVAAADEVQHGVVDLLGCRACHEPHGGEGEKLLRRSGPDLCLSCHDSRRAPEADAVTVNYLDAFEVPATIARRSFRLVLSADGVADHPVAGHRTLGTPTRAELKTVDVEFEGELTCLSCHDPHKGKSSTILKWGAEKAEAACRGCHLK